VTLSKEIRVSLLDAFELRCGERLVQLPMSARRLLAFLALHQHPVYRVYAAGMLWLETRDERAVANLRSALWRLRRTGLDLVEAKGEQLRLAPSASVDLRDALSYAHQLLAGADCRNVELDATGLTRELLPDWYEDWVLVERERYHQLRLHALEAMTERLLRAGELAGALEAALAAVVGDPLRESAHRLLITVYLAEGNDGDAIRQYHFFRRLVGERLGLAPSPLMDDLVRGLVALPGEARTAELRASA